MADSDFQVQLLPDDGGPVDPDTMLQSAFGDEFAADVQDDIAVEDERRPYGRSWAWDYASGRFVMHGTAPAQVREREALRSWILKAVYTARLAHPIYSSQFGVDDPVAIIGEPVSASGEAQALYEESVRAALLAHDRITDVSEFAWPEPDPDSEYLEVSFAVVTDDEDEMLFASLELPT